MKKTIFSIILLGIISCNKNIAPELPENLFEKYKSSVVLIVNQYYYVIQSGEDTYYYSPSSDEKIFTTEVDVLKNLSTSTGTGFVISNDGEIITNRHVINPKDENYKKELYSYYQIYITDLSKKAAMYNDSIESIKNYYYENSSSMDDYQKEEFEKKYKYLSEAKSIIEAFGGELQKVDFSGANIKLVSVNIGIAYDNTFVKDWEDLQECVVIKESKDDNVDLALIQTKNKSFNTEPNFIFNFQDNNPNVIENPENNKERNIKKPVKINEDVFMIGFNRGFSLANTKKGIKSQFTSGKISQENDGERILYTIPTLEGSSGSPIIDKWGNLVGVNFAKLTDSQNFSFGIPVNEVKKFYEE